jgi:hypothetical protein
LEKAWAKVNGNYENTIAGTTGEALRALTGAPIAFYNHDYEEELWDVIKTADRSNFAICASSGNPE